MIEFREPESEEWQPEPEDFTTTTEGAVDYPEPTAEVEVVEVCNILYACLRRFLKLVDSKSFLALHQLKI